MYRLIISEKAKDPYGRALEILGSYNPHSKELKVKADRIKYWLKQGSQMSPTVNNLLIEKDIIEGDKVKASIARKKKKEKEESEKATPEAKEKTEVKEEKGTESATEENKSEEKPIAETQNLAPEAEKKEESKPEDNKDSSATQEDISGEKKEASIEATEDKKAE